MAQIRLHLGSATLDPIPRLTADYVAGGSHYANVSNDWSLIWHANCARVILIRVNHVGRVVWYSGRVSPFRRRRRVACVGRVGARWQFLCRRVQPFSTSKFYTVFTSVLVSSFSS
jgi:hypothetical protein